MDSAVRIRKNHYETLGLKPTASNQEIGQGFARAMRSPHPIPEIAQIAAAFATLADPAKRRVYDEALGLVPEPQQPSAIGFRLSKHLAVTAPAVRAEPRAVTSTTAELLIQRKPQPEAQLKKSTPDHGGVLPAPPITELLATGSNREGYPRGGKQQFIDGKNAFIVIGSLVVSVGLIGAWAGAHAEDTPPKGPQSALTVALPPVGANSEAAEVPGSSSNRVTEPEFISPALIERARKRIRARTSVHRRAGSDGALESPAGGAAEAIDEQPGALGAKLPLPNLVIARTIERIGYACGAVASSTAVKGDESGAYKVTCTSGQSYQARPVHGRYHFRRW